MNNGWIKLHRRIQQKAFYRKPYYLALWTHLLLSANHSGAEFLWNGKTITVHSGQFITGRKQLSEQSGIPETTIERILTFFEKEGQIGQQKTTKYRLITIRKWNDYQILDNKRTTSGQQADTNKNDKKEKNISGASAPVDIPLKDKQDTMGWNKRSDNDDELPAIDMDSREEIETEETKAERETKELNEKIRHNLKLLEEFRGTPFGTGKDMNFHVKIYRDLVHKGWSHESIAQEFMAVCESEFWQEQNKKGLYVGMNTIQSSLRNKKVT